MLVQQNASSEGMEINYSNSLKSLITIIVEKLEPDYLEKTELPEILKIPEEIMIDNPNDIFYFTLEIINQKCELMLDADAIILHANVAPVRHLI